MTGLLVHGSEPPRSSRKRYFIRGGAGLIGLIGLILFSVLPLLMLRPPQARRDDPEGRQQVVEMFERGDLFALPIVQLPSDLADLTVGGWVCTGRSSAGVSVGFPMKLGILGRWER